MSSKISATAIGIVLLGLYLLIFHGFAGIGLFVLLMMYLVPVLLLISLIGEMRSSHYIPLSIFIAIGIVPAIVYYLGFVLGSLRFALIVSTVLLAGIRIAYPYIFKHEDKGHSKK